MRVTALALLGFIAFGGRTASAQTLSPPAGCEPPSVAQGRLQDSLLERAFWAFEGEPGSYRRVIQGHRQAAQVAPIPAHRWGIIRVIYSSYNKPDTAAAIALEAVTAWPHCLDGYVSMAISLADAKRDSLAAASVARVVATFPSDAIAWAMGATVLARLGRLREAADHFQKALALDGALFTHYPHLQAAHDSIARRMN
jgi:tetratricopeptide (TPR) repeat protein